LLDGVSNYARCSVFKEQSLGPKAMSTSSHQSRHQPIISASQKNVNTFFRSLLRFGSLCLVRSFEAAKTNLARIVPRLQGPFLSNPNLLIILTY